MEKFTEILSMPMEVCLNVLIVWCIWNSTITMVFDVKEWTFMQTFCIYVGLNVLFKNNNNENKN